MIDVNDIIKLARKFANTHRQYAEMYDSTDDYVQELVLSVISNVDTFDNTKGAFSTWCYTVYGTKIVKDLVYQLRQKRTCETVSLDAAIDDDGTTLSDLIVDNTCSDNIEDRLHSKLIYKMLYPYLSENFKDYYFNDKTLDEIAQKEHTCRQNIFKKLNTEVSRLRSALENDNLNLIKRYSRRNVNKEVENDIRTSL